MLRALCDADFGALHESFSQIGRIADPIDRLRKLGQAYIEFALRVSQPLPAHVHDAASCIDLKMPATRAGAATPIRTPTHSSARPSSKRSRPGSFRDEYQDPDLLSQVFWSGVHGVAALHLIMGDDTWVQWRPVEEVAQTAIELIIRGLVRNGRGRKGKNGG